MVCLNMSSGERLFKRYTMDMMNEYDNISAEKPEPRFKWKLPKRSQPGKPRPTLWTIGASLSIALNLLLLIIVIVLATQLFTIKEALTDDLVGGLYYNFLLMDQAEINTTVRVEDTIPVQFQLPLNQKTVVVLTEATPIDDARVSLTTGGLNITNAPADIILPAGTELPVRLDLVVPVDTSIPVVLTVPVDIPLSETELHTPFVGLQEVVSPYYQMLNDLPGSWHEVRCLIIPWGCGE
jgi:hypothetical protein